MRTGRRNFWTGCAGGLDEQARASFFFPGWSGDRICAEFPARMKRFSILTASFGEGHNTAARNIRDALQFEAGEEIAVEVCDLYQRTNPRLNRGMQVGYSVAINRFPKIWAMMFGALGVRGLLETMLPTLAALREAMREHFREFRPTCIVSTYPVYSFLVRKIKTQSPFLEAPLVTVITDSTRINSAWYRCPSDVLMVADELTAQALEADGVDPSRIKVYGFPISPRFAELQTLPGQQTQPPYRLLYLPSTRRRHTMACLQELLEVPGVEMTVPTGRNKELFEALQRGGFGEHPRVNLLGWTDQMPELLAGSHLFLGKAGGAIVQEAIAARVPFLVSHIVPGQEEGNIELIEKLNIGSVANRSPQELGAKVRAALADEARLWRQWKNNIEAVSRPEAGRDIARFLLRL
jgi:processive 1,2-diacylglycerol beta-glucosyltransferase